MDQTKIGKFIAVRRKEHGLLQKDIAARLGIILNTNKIKEKICAEIQYIRDCRLDFF